MTPKEINAILKTLKASDIAGIECKHAVYTTSKYNDKEDTTNNKDMVIVKELIHLKDGRKLPRLKEYPNYERHFWLVHKSQQNYEDKKEWEYLDKLKKYPTIQCKLNQSIVRAQGWGNPNSRLQMLARNQYLFGCDISTPALIKAAYQKRCPDLFTPNTVAVIDSETDVHHGDGKDPILLTITFRDKVLITVRKDWIEGIASPKERIMEALEKHLGDIIEKRKIKFEIMIIESMGQMCVEVMNRAHEWQPDFVTFWNMDFDITVMIQALENEGFDLAEVFSDPRVPEEFRSFHYRRQNPQKEKADGSTENLASYDRWNVATFPASFQFIDAMCVYRQIRKAKGKAPSYGLGYTLQEHLKRGKLYFDTGDSTAEDGSIEWHMQMQRNFKIPYIVYNVFDCIGIELLDEKTKDLQTQVSILSGFSEYAVFHSNPKRAADALHFFCLELGKVAGCVSDKMIDENDKYLLGKEEWIVTLPTHLVIDNGLHMLLEMPTIRSLIRMYVSDADITSTYPNGEIIMNLSKETTMMELGRIHGISASRQRLIGINVTGGPSNAIELLTEVVGAPRLDQLLVAFREHLEKEAA